MKSIPRVSVSEAVARSLRAEIESGAWPIGTRIPTETELSEMFGVSRTAVREGVRGLVQAGLLRTKQGAGTFVQATDATDVALQRRLAVAKESDVAAVRRGLDVIAARLAATQRSRADVEALRRALDDRRAAAKAQDGEQFVSADVRFHLRIAQASGNEVLEDFYRSLSSMLMETLKTDNCFDVPLPTTDWHEELYRHIRDRNEQAAGAAALSLVEASSDQSL